MAYSNIAWIQYLQLKSAINTEIDNCEIANKNELVTTESEQEFTHKYHHGLILRLAGDSEDIEKIAPDYAEYVYRWDGLVFVSTPNESQKDLMDLVEHIKYALINNRTNATWQSIFGIETEYPPPEVKEHIQFANITFEVLYDG